MTPQYDELAQMSQKSRAQKFSCRQSRLFFLSCCLLVTTSLPSVQSFTSRIGPIFTEHRLHQLDGALFAKKAQNKSNNKSASTVGRGFGTAPKTSGSSGQLEGKARTLSGFSGSGTKPLRQAANTFDEIRGDHGKACCWDVYCKSPLDDPDRLWFVGKIAVRPDTAATPTLAVISQKRVILEYAKRELRPQNLGGKYADSLELWLAPGDTEMECVQNKISLEPVVGSMSEVAEVEDFSVSDVGYNPEIYVGDERAKGGLRITRDEKGNPIKPGFEINN